MTLFQLSELDHLAPAGSGILKSRFHDIHLVKVESIKSLVGNVPSPGECFFLWTVKSFNAYTFIPFFVKEHKVINELILSTYSISNRILESLTHLMEKGKVEKVHILISDSIKFRLPKVQEQLVLLCNQRPAQFTVSYAWNHSKISLIQTPGGCFVVEGSGNFSENAQHEQYLFLNIREVYDFRKAEIYGIISETKK
ncbi:MAG: hypothetical protein WCO63_16445 [Bacteroidota bacterium]